MKKSLIALTLAALPVAAVADVTLYGQNQSWCRSFSNQNEKFQVKLLNLKLLLRLLTTALVSASKATSTWVTT